jgi:hypothetical protein
VAEYGLKIKSWLTVVPGEWQIPEVAVSRLKGALNTIKQEVPLLAPVKWTLRLIRLEEKIFISHAV